MVPAVPSSSSSCLTPGFLVFSQCESADPRPTHFHSLFLPLLASDAEPLRETKKDLTMMCGKAYTIDRLVMPRIGARVPLDSEYRDSLVCGTGRIISRRLSEIGRSQCPRGSCPVHGIDDYYVM